LVPWLSKSKLNFENVVVLLFNKLARNELHNSKNGSRTRARVVVCDSPMGEVGVAPCRLAPTPSLTIPWGDSAHVHTLEVTPHTCACACVLAEFAPEFCM
jgi:hypothetical protein